MAKIRTETWYDDRSNQIRITCDETSCLIELSVDASTDLPLVVEILSRPRSKDGLPVGQATVIHREKTVACAVPDRTSATARFWLPANINFQTARNLFYRIVSAGSQ